MSDHTVHPQDDARETSPTAVLDALGIANQTDAGEDETAYLLSSEVNKARLLNAIENQGKGSRVVSLDAIWK